MSEISANRKAVNASRTKGEIERAESGSKKQRINENAGAFQEDENSRRRHERRHKFLKRRMEY